MSTGWVTRFWWLMRRLAALIRSVPAAIALPTARSSRLVCGVARGGTNLPELTAVADPTPPVDAPPPFRTWISSRSFAELRSFVGPALIDLTEAQFLAADVFEQIAAAWTASANVVPRLGLVLSFERWALLHQTARNALAPVVARGVAVELFYVEQREGGQIDLWFENGRLVHNLPAVIDRLRQRWVLMTGPGHWPAAIDTQVGTDHWPALIDTLAGLVRSECSGDDIPAMLIEVAGLAQLSKKFEVAERLAQEALSCLTTPSGTRAEALRCLGIALICQDQPAAGQAALTQAVTVATACGQPTVAARALFELGFVTLEQRDYLTAQRAFRAAVDLLTDAGTRFPSLLALAHRGLALALMHGGYIEAEYHARAAHALHSGIDPEQAEFDRQLIKRLLAAYPDNN